MRINDGFPIPVAVNGQLGKLMSVQGIRGAVRVSNAFVCGTATGGDNNNIIDTSMNMSQPCMIQPGMKHIIRLEHDGVTYIRGLAMFGTPHRIQIEALPEGVSVSPGDPYELYILM